MVEKRVASGDVNAMRNLACHYSRGDMGLPQNYKKAMKLWLRAGELGCAMAYNNLGASYEIGRGVVRDEKKANHYYALAAMGGNAMARHNLGAAEYNAGNMNRAVQHWMISSAAGLDDSLSAVRKCFMHGYATKDDFEKALRAHKDAKDEMKSEQRDAAVAASAQIDD